MTLRIAEIVVTGGPCAGKSTALRHFGSELSKTERRILVAPEIPTHLINAGLADIANLIADPVLHYGFEKIIFSLFREQRAHFKQLAEILPEKEVAILYDRGELDIGAYMKGEDFSRL